MSSPTFELNSTMVRAGAGAGKTTRLVAEVLRVAEGYFAENGRFPNMILTTFTRKATQELKERLVLKAVELGDERLLDYLSGSQLQVSTIHGVMSVFLKRYGHLAGLDSAFTMTSFAESKRLAKSELRKLAHDNESIRELAGWLGFSKLAELLMALSEQKTLKPGLRFAEETDLTAIAAQFFAEQMGPMHTELDKLLAEVSEEKFRHYIEIVLSCIRDLKNGKSIELVLSRIPTKPRLSKKEPQMSDESHELLTQTVKELKALAKRPELNPETFADRARHYENIHLALEAFSPKWMSEKIDRGVLDSSDLESMGLFVLRQYPELGDAFAKEYDYWLIDEFQDTSPVQVELLKRLSGKSSQFLVGDPQQSIYLFRGSRSEVFDQRQKQIIDASGQFDTLETNWRSQPELLEFFNDLFAGMSSGFSRMKPRQPVEDSSRVVATIAITHDKDLGQDPDQQMASVAQYIEQRVGAGARYEDICILARTNSQLKELAKYLKRQGFPTHLHSSGGFYSRREIIDALSLLKFLVQPSDNKNLVSLLRTPYFRIPDEVLAEILIDCKGTYWEKLKQLEDHSSLQLLKAWRKRLQTESVLQVYEEALVEVGIFDLSRHQDATGRKESNIWKWLQVLRAEEKMPGFSYLKFTEGSAFDSEGEELEDESDAIAALEPNHIQLMTVHASKGLQFPHVLLPNLEKGSRPARSEVVSVMDSEVWSAPLPLGENEEWIGSPIDLRERYSRSAREAEESLRVFYVAATRAKESLFMSFQGESFRKGAWANQLPLKTKPGVHQTSHYSYEVVESPFKEVSRSRVDVEVSSIREKFQQEVPAETLGEQVSVTELIKEQFGSEEKTSGVEAPKSLLPEIYKKTADGTYFHRVMEALRYNSSFDYKSMARQWFHRDSDSIVGAIEWTLGISEPPMQELLTNGFVEWGFQYLENGQIVEGQVDLWGQVDDDIWIVDYKTGRPEDLPKAIAQLKVYSKAILASGKSGRIRLAVVFPMNQTVHVEEYGGEL